VSALIPIHRPARDRDSKIHKHIERATSGVRVTNSQSTRRAIAGRAARVTSGVAHSERTSLGSTIADQLSAQATAGLVDTSPTHRQFEIQLGLRLAKAARPISRCTGAAMGSMDRWIHGAARVPLLLCCPVSAGSKGTAAASQPRGMQWYLPTASRGEGWQKNWSHLTAFHSSISAALRPPQLCPGTTARDCLSRWHVDLEPAAAAASNLSSASRGCTEARALWACSRLFGPQRIRAALPPAPACVGGADGRSGVGVL